MDSARKLYKYPELGEIAYPILLKHLRLDYPDRILEGIASAFTKDVARRHWQELLRPTSPRTVAKSATAWPQR